MAINETPENEKSNHTDDFSSSDLSESQGGYWEQAREKMERFKGIGSQLEVEVIDYRQGLSDGKRHTLEETIQKFGITRDVIRSIEGRFECFDRCRRRNRRISDFLKD